MPAAYANLYIEQGTTFTSTITLDDVYGDNFDLTGYTANSQIRKSYYSSNAAATFATSINTGDATITLQLTAQQTSAMAPGQYVYDTIINYNGTVTRVLEGLATVSPRVTR